MRGSDIQQFRQAHDLTQAQIAAVCGLSQPEISLIENDKMEIPFVLEKYIADYPRAVDILVYEASRVFPHVLARVTLEVRSGSETHRVHGNPFLVEQDLWASDELQSSLKRAVSSIASEIAAEAHRQGARAGVANFLNQAKHIEPIPARRLR